MTKITDGDSVRFSLKTKLFLVVLVSFGVLTLVIVLHIRREADHVADREIEKSLNRSRSVLQTRLASRFESITEIARNFTRDGVLRPAVYAGESSLLQDLSREQADSLGFDVLIFTDAEGTVLARSDDAEAIGKSVSDRSHLFTSALSGKPTRGFMNRRGELLQIVALPVRDNVEPDIVRGTVALAYRLSDELIREIKDLTACDIVLYIFAAKAGAGEPALPVGSIGTYAGDLTELVDQFAKDAVLLHHLYDGRPVANRVLTLAGNVWHAVFVPLTRSDGVPLGFALALRSRNELTQPFRSIQLAAMFFGLICLAVASLTAYLIARRVSQPIIDLVGVTHRIRESDFPAYQESGRGDEVGLLSNAVLRMGQALKERAELENYLASASANLEDTTGLGAAVSETTAGAENTQADPVVGAGGDAAHGSDTPGNPTMKMSVMEASATGIRTVTTTKVRPTTRLVFEPGSALGDRYKIIKQLGVGGMGRVYLAEDEMLSERVALKTILLHDLPPGVVDQVKQELRLARLITHPNVVRNHDIGLAGDGYYISMEYVEGIDLLSLVNRRGPFKLKMGVLMLRQLCSAIAAAHRQGIIHRDLKPQNIMINTRGILKIMDFGIALQLTGERPGTPKVISGTPMFMAPEQFMGGEIDQRTDIYALGLNIFFVFSGRLPFKGDSLEELRHKHLHEDLPPLRTLRPELPEELEALLNKALQKEKEDRFQDVAQLLRALNAVPVE